MAVYIFLGVPIVAFIWFIVSLILFLQTPKEDVEKRRTRKIMLIISVIVTTLFVLAIAALILLFISAIGHM